MLQESSGAGLAPSSSTPLKDSTPTNQGEIGDHLVISWLSPVDPCDLLTDCFCLEVTESQDNTDNTIDEEQVEASETPVKDILESSDC